MDHKNKIRLLNCCLGSWIIIGLIFIFMGLFILESLIENLAKENIKMAQDTYDIWGQMPGKTQTVTIRDCTLFNFTNPHGFLYRQEKPVFNQKSGYIYQEESKFVNYKYTNNQELLQFDYWLHFELFNTSRDVNESNTLINLAPLGFWMQLDSVPIYTFTLQGYGGLFLQLNDTILTQAFAQGISAQFLSNYSDFNLVCNNLDISQQFCYYLWNDRFYGLNNFANIQPWVQASFYNDQDSKQFLIRYFFPLPIRQFEGLLQTFKAWSQTLNSILNNWYCEGKQCSSYELSVGQLSQSAITSKPPAGDPSESICSLNSTCIGSPEIPTFLHHEFKEMYPDQKYQQLTFSVQSISKLFVPTGGVLNIGSLKIIFQLGLDYDHDPSTEKLILLKEELGMETNDHTFVVWQWIKYMTHTFVLKENKNGTRKIAGLGGFFSQSLYQASYQFSEWFFKDIFSFLTYKNVKNCSEYFQKNVDFFQAEISSKICEQVSPKNYSTYYPLIEPCLSEKAFQDFQSKYAVNYLDMSMYCDIDSSPSYFGELAIQIHAQIADYYNCTQSYSKKCTDIDIIIKQAFFSSITLNPWKDEEYPFVSEKSVNSWNKQIPMFEYEKYLNLANTTDSQVHTEAQMRNLFNFDVLLSGPTTQELLIEQNQTEFRKKYLWNNPVLLRNYIRFVTIQVGFGGFTQERTAQEWFFGYTDPFLQNFKNTDPMKGGDPSINPVVMLNQPNSTVQEAVDFPQTMWTGYKDVQYTRNYYEVFKKPYITYNYTYFDGKNINSSFVSPWLQEVPLQGSDGFQNPPQMSDDETCQVYLSTLCRFGSLYFNTTLEKYGMQLHDMRLEPSFLQSKYDNKDNVKYNQGLGGFLNTSFQGFPAYISKNHFLDAPENWSKLVQINDETGQHQMTPNKWDDSYIFLQPYTGASFTATIFLQSSYYYVPDILFPESQTQNKTERMLPMFSVYRSGNISESVVEDTFGILKTAISAKRVFVILGSILIGVIVLVYCAVRQTQVIENVKKQSLLQSQAQSSEQVEQSASEEEKIKQ